MKFILEDGIYRLKVPFEVIYTMVFALNEGDKGYSAARQLPILM